MKILQLSNRIPYPLNDGGNIGVNYYTRGFLEAGVTLSFLTMNTTRHWTDPQQLPGWYRKLHYFEAVKVDNRIKPLAAFLNLFRKSSYNIDRFVSAAFARSLTRVLQRESFDIVQLESLFLTPYVPLIRRYSKAKIVIRQHNVEFKIWERLAAQERQPLKRAYLKLLTRRLRRFEMEHLNDYDLVLPISTQDAHILNSLGLKKPMFLHPFGIDIKDIPFQPGPINEALCLYHIGAMDWLPNQESMLYFLDQIMPLIRKRHPTLKCYLAGRNMPDIFFRRHWENVEILGEVPDARAFEQDKTILVVPLQSGGGVRIKILQAMAMGKAVVSTPVGIEGIAAKDGKEVMVAGDPESFAEKIDQLVAHPARISELGTAARKLIQEKYDRTKLIADLLERYDRLCNES